MSVNLVPTNPFMNGGFLRLWAVGGIAAAMMWLEVLAASLFVLAATQSGWAVALVAVARTVPLLLFGAVAGVVSDAWDRKRIVQVGLVVAMGSAGTVALLAATGLVQPWHVALAGFVSGSVYATDMSARRRMIAESTGAGGIDAAVAADSLTSYAARCIGPLIGGATYGSLGLAGAFAISAVSNAAAAVIMLGLVHGQDIRRLSLGPIGRDLRDAVLFAARTRTLLTLLVVTVTMNACGYAYSTLLTPVAKEAFGLSDTLTGVLTAAEPGGAFLGGVLLMRAVLPGPRIAWLMGGVAILTGALLVTAGLGTLGAPLVVVCLAMAVGGLGSAVYTNNQTSIAMAETPPAMRSRMMGLVTVCIGSWPLGMVFAGALARTFPPLTAMAVLAACGLVVIGGIALAGRRWPARVPHQADVHEPA